MIPAVAADLDSLVAEVERQHSEVHELLAGAGDAAATWRPSDNKWSMTGHVAHMAIINEAYLGAIEAALQAAQERGVARSDGPYRHPRVTSWFARSNEPPPKRRIKTFRSMTPDPGTTSRAALADFDRYQGKMAELIESSRGIDLGRVRFGSPYLALLRFSLGTGFALLLAHNRRHIWLMREVMDTEGFPGEFSGPVKDT